ncbi:hypothetical protein Sinac_0125 [Singulisphaera acidiphila DSM 18658]|uniref:Uncharacterized protein n=1 Tax=Singulisphaera acidiphila (strain ATCC BAA-1392 / DSM 18658 / VKM B-2454 / MOB10) TaxID=886293 RepID=L0D6X2_SINAD|nr:hypothetical protein Sinac_0125 [Singulisphaera acidiphila DSM 18658]
MLRNSPNFLKLVNPIQRAHAATIGAGSSCPTPKCAVLMNTAWRVGTRQAGWKGMTANFQATAQSVRSKSNVFDPLLTVAFSPEVSGFSYFVGLRILGGIGFLGI